MSIIGVDFGNGFTKTSKKNIVFKSSYMNGFDSDLNSNSIKIELEGERYTVGVERDQGIVDSNVNTRYDSKLHELSILTAIALSFDEAYITTAVVVGVPADNYDNLKDKVAAIVKEYTNKSVKLTINNKCVTKFITITNVLVMPQSAVVFLDADKYRNKINFVLDIGGGTAIASIWRGMKFTNVRTINMGGMLRLYTAIAQKINKELNTNYNSELIQHALEIGEIKDGYGNKYIIDKDERVKKLIEYTIESHISKLVSDIEEVLSDEPALADIQILTGGGALSELIRPYLKKYYKNLEVTPYPQFANAIVYEAVGRAKCLDKEAANG